jgi:hypothetical protein
MASQSTDRGQAFGSEFRVVPGKKVNLDVIRTSPLETAERAVARRLVYVLPVPGELLGTSKTSFAIGTDSLSVPVHVTTVTVLIALDSYMPSGSLRQSLRHVSCTRTVSYLAILTS